MSNYCGTWAWHVYRSRGHGAAFLRRGRCHDISSLLLGSLGRYCCAHCSLLILSLSLGATANNLLTGTLARHPLQCAIPPILNRIVCPPFQTFCNLGPFVPQLCMQLGNLLILLVSPLTLVYVRVEMIVPTFPALFAQSPLELPRDEAPLLLTVDLHQLHNCGILLRGPRTFDQPRFEDLLPTMQALHVGPTWKVCRYLFPILSGVTGHSITQEGILVNRPFAHRCSAFVGVDLVQGLCRRKGGKARCGGGSIWCQFAR